MTQFKFLLLCWDRVVGVSVKSPQKAPFWAEFEASKDVNVGVEKGGIFDNHRFLKFSKILKVFFSWLAFP